jgi:hypothetical protein
LVDGTQRGSAVEYTQATSYTRLTPGVHNVRADVANTGVALFELPLTVAASTNFTLVAITAGSPPLVVTDTSTAPGANQAKVRVIHASETAGNVDVYISARNVPLTDSDREITNAAFGSVSSYVSVPVGTYQIRVTPTGTQTVGIDLTSLDLGRGQVKTIVVVGNGSLTAPLGAVALDDR